MINKIVIITGTLAFLTANCKANEKSMPVDSLADRALITRYVSLLNVISKKDLVPQEKEIRREIFLALTINYFYFKDKKDDTAKNFKSITNSISINIKDFDYKSELNEYIKMIKSLDKDAAIVRIQLDGFDEKLANIILDKSYRNDFEDLTSWVAEK